MSPTETLITLTPSSFIIDMASGYALARWRLSYEST